jgi:hypothetical protein
MTTDRIAVDIKVPNQTRYLCLIGQIGENIAHTLRNYGGDRAELAYALNLVLTEAMANAIQHANEKDPAKEVHIEISIVDQVYVSDGHGVGIQKLNPGSSLIWGILEDQVILAEIIDLLCTAFPEHPRSAIATDCANTLQQFLENHLIKSAISLGEH